MAGERMATEIREQPAAYRRLLASGQEPIAEIAGHVRRRKPRFVILAARGTSDHAALYAKYLVETKLELPAGLASPSAVTVYGARPAMKDVLFIVVSQSGTSPDLVETLFAARQAGAITVAFSNDPTSAAAEAAEWHIDVLAGEEQAVAATKTYTAELLALYLFIAALRGRSGRLARDLVEAAEEVLAAEPSVARLAGRYRFAEQIVVTSRGYNYPTAREAALKLMEAGNMVAHAFSGADLLHGPLAMIHRGFPVVAIVPPGRGGKALRPVLRRLEDQRADVLAVSMHGDHVPATVALELPVSVPEELSPLLMILPLQQLVLHLALEKGIDPDRPAGLSKVTRTR